MSDLPSGWEWAELSEVCTSITDGDHQPPPQTSSGIPFLVIGNIRKKKLDFNGCRFVSEEYFRGLKPIRRPQKGDVLYSLVGSYGISVPVLDDRKFCVQRHIGILRPSSIVDTAFLSHLLNSPDVYDQATQCATGTAQLTVPLSGLRCIRIPVPSRAEQERITAVIDEQFSRIDAGAISLENVRRGLALARSQVINSAAEGWRRIPLGEIIDVLRNGIFVSRPTAEANGPAILRISSVRPMALDAADIRYVPADADLRDPDKYFVDPGDLLFTRYSGTAELVGACAMVPNGVGKLLHPDKLIRVKVNRSIAEPRFIELMAAADATRREIRSRIKTTAGQTGISGTDLKSVQFPVPPIDMQRQMTEEASAEFAHLRKVEELAERAEKRTRILRAAILASAFSGRLK